MFPHYLLFQSRFLSLGTIEVYPEISLPNSFCRASVQRQAEDAANMAKYNLVEKDMNQTVSPSPMEYIQAFSVTRQLPRTPNNPGFR